MHSHAEIWQAPHIILLVAPNAGGASTRGEIAAAACLDQDNNPLVKVRFMDMSDLIEYHITQKTPIGKEFERNKESQNQGNLQPDKPILQAIKEMNETLAAEEISYVIWRGPARNTTQAKELGEHYHRGNLIYYPRTEEYSVRATAERRKRAEEAFRRDPTNDKPPRKDDTAEGAINRYRNIYQKQTIPALGLLARTYHWPVAMSHPEPDIAQDVLKIIGLIIANPLISDEIKTQICANLEDLTHPAGKKIAAIKKADEESPIIQKMRPAWETKQPQFEPIFSSFATA
jgi:adenylate kinase family enzyme